MTLVDPISDALANLKNHERAAKRTCQVKHASKLLGEVLRVLQEQKYIVSFERVKKTNGDEYTVQLLGSINDCRAIKPRYAVKKNDYERFEKRYLPARDVGLLIVSTPEGVVTHRDAKRSQIGGRLIAYIY